MYNANSNKKCWIGYINIRKIDFETNNTTRDKSDIP